MKPAKLIAIAVVEQSDAFLVGQRPAGVALAGYWEFPGGKVHEGEQPADAAVRECHEETGLRVRATELLDRHIHQYAHGSVDLHFYRCELIEPHSEPSPPFAWISRERLASLEFPDGNQGVLRRLG
jgi:mutator protein MutT